MQQLNVPKDLRSREDLIIKPANKGEALVVMDTLLYRQEALSNEHCYRSLTVPLYKQTVCNLYQVLERMSKIGKTDRTQLDYLKANIKK